MKAYRSCIFEGKKRRKLDCIIASGNVFTLKIFLNPHLIAMTKEKIYGNHNKKELHSKIWCILAKTVLGDVL